MQAVSARCAKLPAMGDEATIDCVVVDDHEMLQRGLAHLLNGEDDIRVVGQAATSRQALRLNELRRPDVLVVDVELPDGSGIDLCKAIKLTGTAVLLYSAHDDPELVEAALEAGADGYLLKSSPPQGIVHAVRLVSAGQRYIDATLAPRLLRRSENRRALLSTREREVLQHLSEGHTTDHAAGLLHLSPATVRSYAESAMRKLEAGNRTQAVAQALRLQLID